MQHLKNECHTFIKMTELNTHLMDKVLQLSLLSPEGGLLLILVAWLNAGWGKQSTNYYT